MTRKTDNLAYWRVNVVLVTEALRMSLQTSLRRISKMMTPKAPKTTMPIFLGNLTETSLRLRMRQVLTRSQWKT